MNAIARLPRCLLLLAMPGLCACAASVPSSPTGSAATDTAGADWGCLASAGAGDPLLAAATDAVPLGLTVRVRLAYSGVPVTDAEVVACGAADTGCDAPLAAAHSDVAGEVLLGASAGLDVGAVLRITGSEIATHYVFLAGRGVSAADAVLDVDVYTPVALQLMAGDADVAWDPTLAVVRVDARDCAGASAGGVAVSVGTFAGGAPVVAYLDAAGRPTRRQPGTGADGVAIGFSVPPGDFGVADMLGVQPAGGAVAFARAGAVSLVTVAP